MKDKGVLELIDEIKKELRTRSIEDKAIPRFIFVCGEQILDDNGNLIDETILDTQNNIRYLIMKKFSKYKQCGEYEKESHPAQCTLYNSSFCFLTDDIVISSNQFIDVYIIEDIDYLLKEYGFKRNIGKTYFMSKHKKREITGIVIDNNNNSFYQSILSAP